MPSTPSIVSERREDFDADILNSRRDFAEQGGWQGGGPPARKGILESARQHWVTTLVCVFVFAGLAATYAIARPAVYTATARLSVSAGNPNDPAALPGVVQATQGLAAAYSRTVQGAPVARRAAERLRTTPSNVAAHVSATPVPESPLITLQATGGSARAAVALASATSDALVASVASADVAQAARDRTLRAFQQAALDASRVQTDQSVARKQYLDHPTPQNQSLLDDATASADAAVLRREGLRAQYQDAQQSVASGPSVQVLEPASTASSDRLSRAQLIIFAGVVGGLVVGLAAATLRSNRRAARS